MDHPAAAGRARYGGAAAVKPVKPPNDMVLTYKGKSFVAMTEAEIVNNTIDGLMNTGVLIEFLIEAMNAVGVFEDLATTWEGYIDAKVVRSDRGK
jgi:hypothetical protein